MPDHLEPDGPPGGAVDFPLLDRFLAGECSPAEAELLRRWLSTAGGDARYVDAVRDALERRDAAASTPDTDAAWARLARDTVDPERNAERLPPPLRLTAGRTGERSRLRRVLTIPWLRAAAIVALVAGAGALWIARNRGAPAPLREYTTMRGERAEFQLPDGTRVLLAPESRLGVPVDFGADRRVELEGQAYFDVVHDERKAFEVRAGDAVMHDLGTRFVVRAYPEGSRVEVAVAEGRVALSGGRAAEDGIVIGVGQVGRAEKDGVPTVTDVGSLNPYFGWTRGVLVIEDRPLAEALADLQRWYDTELKVEDARLAARLITTTAGDTPLVNVLAGIVRALDARYEQRGDTVVVVP
jgi:transmembrane sensor